jgi:hypothetical protein
MPFYITILHLDNLTLKEQPISAKIMSYIQLSYLRRLALGHCYRGHWYSFDGITQTTRRFRKLELLGYHFPPTDIDPIFSNLVCFYR